MAFESEQVTNNQRGEHIHAQDTMKTPLRICWTRYEPHFDIGFKFRDEPEREPEESERESEKSLDKSNLKADSGPKQYGNNQ